MEKPRNEQRFASLDELVAQINKDRDQAYEMAQDEDWEM